MASRHSERPGTDEQGSASADIRRSDNSNDNPDALQAQAERCRRLAQATYNREVSEMLGSMAEDYERSAAQLSTRQAN